MGRFNIRNRRYLGSKAKLIEFISNVVQKECVKSSTFLDLFAGTGNVAWYFNDKMDVYVNDLLQSNYLSYIAFFGNELIEEHKINNLIKFYNSLTIDEDNYFSLNFSNTYFSDGNCKKIGFIRQDIESKYKNSEINFRERAILITSLIYAMDKIANTVGHYDAFRMDGNLDRELIMKPLELPSNGINDNNQIFCEDANRLVKRLNADIVYIDPPYNSRQYCDAYHLLENVANWEKPQVFGTARKMDRTRLKSKYCTRSASEQFDDLIININAKYILVSYNNMGTKGAGRSQAKISDEDIIRTLSKRGKVKIFEIDFNQFTTGKTNIEDHKERLFLCVVGKEHAVPLGTAINQDLVKSPLNYTGGKYRLLPQLISKFPKSFDTFIDLFGGGFNVGINVNSNLLVYNDKQKEVMRIIRLFYKYDYSLIIKKIEKNILKYNLSNTYKKGYEYYECESDSGAYSP